MADTSHIVGGGPKKVLYTLATIARMGVGKAGKALTAKNACKACAYGMGGQRGGMTNELNEFPSVCNKSVQAQSTDIQPAIPHEVFDHPFALLDYIFVAFCKHFRVCLQPCGPHLMWGIQDSTPRSCIFCRYDDLRDAVYWVRQDGNKQGGGQ